jgi:hypothetical protein
MSNMDSQEKESCEGKSHGFCRVETEIESVNRFTQHAGVVNLIAEEVVGHENCD